MLPFCSCKFMFFQIINATSYNIDNIVSTGKNYTWLIAECQSFAGLACYSADANSYNFSRTLSVTLVTSSVAEVISCVEATKF